MKSGLKYNFKPGLPWFKSGNKGTTFTISSRRRRFRMPLCAAAGCWPLLSSHGRLVSAVLWQQVNNQSLLGACHEEAVRALRSIVDHMVILVCDAGPTAPKPPFPELPSRGSPEGFFSSRHCSISSIDRVDDVTPFLREVRHFPFKCYSHYVLLAFFCFHFCVSIFFNGRLLLRLRIGLHRLTHTCAALTFMCDISFIDSEVGSVIQLKVMSHFSLCHLSVWW